MIPHRAVHVAVKYTQAITKLLVGHPWFFQTIDTPMQHASANIVPNTKFKILNFFISLLFIYYQIMFQLAP